MVFGEPNYAFQIRATAFFRSASSLTSVLPGMLFQISTNRLMGQSTDGLASAGMRTIARSYSGLASINKCLSNLTSSVATGP
jgi:hypothetical protein